MNWQKLTTKKIFSPDQIDNPKGLKKELTASGLTAMGVGAIVGAGIFITPGIIAAKHAGPGAMFSYIISAAVCAFAALCYSEFASTIPLAGSAYTYAYTVFGELMAWIIGWSLISEYIFAVSSVAVSWSSYFQSLLAGFNIKLPSYLSASIGTAGQKGGINLIAGIIVLLVGIILLNGVHESTKINNILVLVKIFVIILFIVVAAFYVKPANYSPFLPFGMKGVISGAAVAFYAYIGFDAVSTAAEEVKNPQRDMPIGIVASLVIAAILYSAVSIVLVGVVKYTKLNVGDPVSFALNAINQNWVAGIIALGAIVGMTTVLLVMSYGGTRLLFAISRDGLLPKKLSKINPKTGVPTTNTMIFVIIVAAIATIVPLETIAELVNIGTLFAFATVSIGILSLRKLEEKENIPAGFHVPFYPYIPIISFLLCLVLMTQLQLLTWIVFLIWFSIGIIFYFSYGFKHSKVHQKSSGR